MVSYVVTCQGWIVFLFKTMGLSLSLSYSRLAAPSTNLVRYKEPRHIIFTLPEVAIPFPRG